MLALDALAPALLPSTQPKAGLGAGKVERIRNALSALRLFVILLGLVLLSRFFVVVPAGERGVLLRFGAVQQQVLAEGLHPLLPVVYSVRPLSVRVQSLPLAVTAASRDLQDVAAQVAVRWHIDADQVNRVFSRLGDGSQVAAVVIQPAIEDGVKAVFARFSAEQLVTERDQLRELLSGLLQERLSSYDLVLDGEDLLQFDFSDHFRQAVEEKQVAEQNAKRAQFEALRAQRLAEARVFQAQGEAQAQELLQTGLTPAVLQRQTIEKWNGHLPLVVGADSVRGLDMKSLLKLDRKA